MKNLEMNHNGNSLLAAIFGVVGGWLEVIYLQMNTNADFWVKLALGSVSAFIFAIIGMAGKDLYKFIVKIIKKK